MLDRTILLVGGIFAAALAAGFVMPDWAIFLTTVAVAKALVVLGLMILWRAGLVSFGQALYFGAGGYAAGLACLWFGLTDAILLVLLGGAVAAAVAWVVGLLLARYREIFFAMLSLAFPRRSGANCHGPGSEAVAPWCPARRESATRRGPKLRAIR
jgi:branched-chain amino acid transport system permease protein